MVELDVEHILILVIVAFMLYHLSSCRCFNNGFRVGGAPIENCLKLKKGCKDKRECIGLRLNDCFAYNVDLSGANLTGANLNGADLVGSNLTGANLTDASLIDTELYHANLTDADLTGANLKITDLTDANLTNASLTKARATRVHLINANLTDASLTHADLTDADLTGANLTHANLEDANLMNADLTGADLTGVNLNEVINHLGAKCSTDEKGTIFPNNSPYTCSSNNLWIHKDCSNTLNTTCPKSKYNTNFKCSICTGKHQHELMAAGCTNDDFKNYC